MTPLSWRPGPFGPWPSGGLLAFHPEENSLWVLGDGDGSASLWRICDGRAEALGAEDDRTLGLDGGLQAGLVTDWEAFWFDPTRKAICVALKGTFDKGQADRALGLFRWAGSRFERILPKGEIRSGPDDRLAIDPVRGVPVHFSGPDGDDPKEAGIRVSELVGDAWNAVANESTDESVRIAGWDGRYGVVAVTKSRTLCWDGKRLETKPGFSADHEMNDVGRRFAQTLPGKVLVVKPDRHDDAWYSLEAKGWTKRALPIDPDSWTYDAGGDRLWLVGARIDPKSPTPLVSYLDSKGAHAAGPACGGSMRVIDTGSGTILGDTLFAEDGSTSFVPFAMGWTAAIPGGFARIGDEIELFAGGKSTKAKRPPALAKRSSEVAVAWDPPRKRALWTYSKERDTWGFDGKKVEALKTKGRPPVASRLAWHPGLESIVAAGGKIGRDEDSLAETGVFDGIAWTSFPTSVTGSKTDPGHARLLEHDPVSGHLFLVWETEVWLWRGRGEWEAVATVAGPAGAGASWQNSRLAWNARTRTLLAVGPRLGREGALHSIVAELGPLLDAAGKPELGTAGAAKKSEAAAAPGGPRRVLVYQAGTSDKFWIGTLEGKSWTAQWGRRGTAGQTKSFPADSESEARRMFDKKVAEKLGEGYVDAPADERPAEARSKRG